MSLQADRLKSLRRIVHAVMAVEAKHRAVNSGDETEITVRLHTKGPRLVGDLQGQAYAEVLMNVDRMVFNVEQIEAAGIELQRNDVIVLTEFGDQEYTLDSSEPARGPIETVWNVVPS